MLLIGYLTRKVFRHESKDGPQFQRISFGDLAPMPSCKGTSYAKRLCLVGGVHVLRATSESNPSAPRLTHQGGAGWVAGVQPALKQRRSCEGSIQGLLPMTHTHVPQQFEHASLRRLFNTFERTSASAAELIRHNASHTGRLRNGPAARL